MYHRKAIPERPWGCESDGSRQLRIEPLNATAQRSEFCCGVDALDDYLSRRAEQDAKRLPKYPLLPATLLGRLAADRRHKGSGLGRLLLMDALRRRYTASLQVASLAVVTEAKDDRSLSFYEAHDFRSFPSRHRTLFLPMGTIALLFGAPAS